MQFLQTKNKSTLYVIALVLFVIASALWLDVIRQGTKDPQLISSGPASIKSNLPDYFMEKYNIISTDINGNAHRWLSGNTLQHYPGGDTNLTRPSLQLSKDQQHWLLLAEKGTIRDNDEQDKSLSLDGNVKIQQLNGKTKPVSIQTEHIDISITENTATTESRVIVSDENGKFTAIGMNVDFDEHELQLLSQVRGHYSFD